MKAECPKGCGKTSKGANFCGMCGTRLPSVAKSATRVFYNPVFAPTSGAATPAIRKSAGSAGQPYVHPTRRGPLFDEDPTVREMTWRDAFGPLIAKGR